MNTTAVVASGRVMAETALQGPWMKVGSSAQIALGAGLGVAYLVALGTQLVWVAMAIVLAGAAVSLAWPASGLAMIALIMPMREPEGLVPIRFNAVLVGGVALGCILRLPIDRLPLRVHPAAVLLVGYLAISGLSILPVLSGHPTAWVPSALNTLLRLATGVTLLLTASYLFRLMSPWPILVLGIVGAALAALLALGDIIGFLPLPALLQGLVENTGSARASGAFADPNFLGLYAASSAVFVIGLISAASPRVRGALIPLSAALIACVILSYSRGALIGLAAGLVVLVARHNLRASVVLALVLVVLGVALYEPFLEARQGGPLMPIDEFDLARSQDSRQAMLDAGIAMFAAFPVLGVGYGVFQFVSPSFVVGAAPDSTFSHNMYVNVLAEQGIVGALLVGTLLVAAAVAVIRSRSPLTNGFLGMGAAFLGASVFLHSATVFQSASLVWLVLAVTLATSRSRIATT